MRKGDRVVWKEIGKATRNLIKNCGSKANISFEEIGISSKPFCQDCGRVCLSKAGLISHSRSPNIGPPVWQANHQCGKQCKSDSELNRHMRIHVDSITNLSAQSNFSCDYCGLECKS